MVIDNDFDNPLSSDLEQEIYAAKRETFGDDITRPLTYVIGKLFEDGSTATAINDGEYNEVWVRLPGEDGGDAVPAVNLSLQPHEITFNRPVWIRKQNKKLYIIGRAPESAEYDADYPVRPQRVVNREQVDIGLLRPTVPSSMSVYVSESYYDYEGVMYRVPGQTVGSFSAYPPVSGAVSVKLEVDPTTGTIYLVDGGAFATKTIQQAFDDGDLDTTTTVGRYVVGWVMIESDTTALERANMLSGMWFTSKVDRYVTTVPSSLTRNTIQPTGDYPNLIFRPFSSQTKDFIDIYDAAGTLIGYWDIDGIVSPYAVQFPTNKAAPVHSEGQMFYDNESLVTATQTKFSGVTLQHGLENWILGRNNTGADIVNGSVVYITGALGNRPTMAYGRADGSITSQTIAMTTHTIANNDDGFHTTFGGVHDIDTSMFNDGDQLFLSPTTFGGVTATRPSSPNYCVKVGTVANAHITEGIVLVNIKEFGELNYLADVEVSSPADGDVMAYDSGLGYWTNRTRHATRVSNSSNISINSGVATALTFDTENYDTDDSHSTSVNTGRLTAITDGKRVVYAQVAFATNVTGLRDAYIILNGATIIARMLINTVTTVGNGAMIVLMTEYNFSATDYIELFARQTSGGALNVSAASDYGPILGWSDV